MAQPWSHSQNLLWSLYSFITETPLHILSALFLALVLSAIFAVYILLHLVAPNPRPVLPSEKTYVTTQPDGSVSAPRQLPCWFDRWLAERHLSEATNKSSSSDTTQPPPPGSDDVPDGFPVPDTGAIEPAEVEVSVVVPAYNEELRLAPALDEMVEYLDGRFGRQPAPAAEEHGSPRPSTPHHRLVFRSEGKGKGKAAQPEQRGTAAAGGGSKVVGGYEIVLVNDGSTDRTVEVALEFARRKGLHDVLRVVTLEKNRGKGGGVTHGFRHVRGEYVVFADADGASRFRDLGRLIEGCEDVVDGSNRGVAIGSRAHLVGSEAVVKRSAIRNFLMRSFHFILMILTPPATSRIRDTQCGFKLFSRASLPHIIPYMHTEGWIFDIEMLMLAESAPATPVLASDGTVIGTSYGIKVAEVPIGWHEVDGSKMNLVQDSIKMALGLAVLRASWMLGVYRRRLT